MTEDTFGFSSASRRTAEKLKAIAPSDAAYPDAELTRVDAAGEALGFVPRESTRVKILRRRKEIGPTVAINMRVPEQVAAKFIEFCDQQRFSYWEGVHDLMKRAGLS